MKIVVLGGAGFVGTRFVADIVDDGHEVVVVDIRSVEGDRGRWIEADVCDEESLEKIFVGADVVINLAAAHRDDIRPLSVYYDINVGGAKAVCAAAASARVPKIIFTSSVAIYGTTGEDEICDENREPRPFNDYGRSKLEAESIYKTWQRGDSERRLVIVRPTVIFGEGNRGNVYNLMQQLASGRFVMIGRGENRKSIAYVGNVSAYLRHCLDLDLRFAVFNYVDKPDLAVHSLIEIIRTALSRENSNGLRIPYWVGWLAGGFFDIVARATGKDFPISRVRVMKFCANTRFCAEAAISSGFSPPFGIEDAIRRTVGYEFGNE